MTRKTTPNRESSPIEVLVVGAGPTGLTLAGDLATAGIGVTVVERRPPETSSISRAFAVHARTLEQLDARGLADELVEHSQAVGRPRLFTRLSLDLGRLPTRFPYVLIAPQFKVERLLKRRAVEAGVNFTYGAEACGLRQDAEGVDLGVRYKDGTEETLRAAYVVGADGVHSAVRSALGLPFPGRSVIRSCVLADVRLAEKPRDLLTLNSVGDTMAFLGSYGDGWYRFVGWDRNRQVADSEPVDLDECKRIARHVMGTDHGMYEARWLSRFHCDERQVPAYRVDRVFLAGDAAHVHSPAGGLGLNAGIQDAANLSWKLAAVLHGHAPDSLLDTYHSERHPVGKAALRISGAILRLAMARTPAQRAFRGLFARFVNNVRPVSAKMMGQLSGIGITYAAAHRAHPLTGKRAPDVLLDTSDSDVRSRLYQVLRAGKFVLITPPGERADTGSRDDRLARTFWPDARRTTMLVRPDGYVAWATDEKAPNLRAHSLRAALAHWTGPTAR